MQAQRTDSAPIAEETRDQLILRLLELGDISIDDNGHVWRHGKRTANMFSPYPAPRRIDRKGTIGYFDCKLTISKGRRITASAHVIQWVKHHGPIPDGFEVNHKDLDKSNNRPGNLELLTHADNLLHAIESHGTNWRKSWCGEAVNTAKLTWPIVRFIREQVGSGKATIAEMARQFGVSQPNVSGIISGKYWKPERDPEYVATRT